MSNYFSSAADAASFMSKLLRTDYFQDFSKQDRVEDPDGIYAIEAEITRQDEDGEETYYWGEKEREAFELFANATPAERAELLDLG